MTGNSSPIGLWKSCRPSTRNVLSSALDGGELVSSPLARASQGVAHGDTADVMNLAALITAPVHALGSAANAGIAAVARIKAHVVLDACRLCIVQLADVVLGWIFRLSVQNRNGSWMRIAPWEGLRC